MTLASGARLGVYEIVSPLGAGGMGEVYRARDSKLGREVAVKLLPARLAADADALARFSREAKLLAVLNHPNIASIFGLEESGGTPFIVMELIPGLSLDEKLIPGALSVNESLAFAAQIVAALEYAHASGIIHRDLKPSNIRVMPSGFVKILDFGLAKAFAEETPAVDMSKSPTLAAEGRTQQGVILGTAAYMSPEQTRGMPLNRQSDIWSFGCVLYEMLTGRQAFGGPTVSDTFVAILTREPDWHALPEKTPLRIRELLRHCLRKEVTGRLHDMGDARIEIKEAAAILSQPIALPPAPRGTRSRRMLKGGIAVAGALIAAVAGYRLSTGPRVPSQKYVAVLPFKDLSGLPGGQLVGDGLVETVSARLSRLPTVQVVTPSVTVAESDRQPDPYKAASALGANLILRGSVQRNGDRVRITYSVLSTDARRQIAGDTLDGSASELFTMQDRLADQVAETLRVRSADRRPTVPSGLESPADQDTYLQAVGLLQRFDKADLLAKAQTLLEALAGRVHSSPLVYASLARTYLYQFGDTHERKWVERANDAAVLARALNADFPEVEITDSELKANTGDARGAIAGFERVLRKTPDNYQALIGLSKAQEAAGNFSGAEAACRRAIEIQPSFWGGYSRLAALFFGRGQYREARDAYRHVTEMTPDNARAFSNLGASATMLDDFEAAVAAYRKSIELQPTAEAYNNLGTVEFYQGNYQESALVFERAVNLAPKYYYLWQNLGDAYRWSEGGRGKAHAAYAKAISLARDELRVDPGNSFGYAILSLALGKTGNASEASGASRRALELDAKNPQILYYAAIVENLNGRKSEALDLLQRAAAAGFSKVMIRRDPELLNLHSEDKFKF